MEVGSSNLPGTTHRISNVLSKLIFGTSQSHNGGLAQLARALAWHARGHRFDPDILHTKGKVSMKFYLFTLLPLKDL